MTERNDRGHGEGSRIVYTDGGYDYEVDEDELLSEAVIEAVADVRDVGPTALPPLYETVDPDGLDELFGPTGRGDRNSDARVEFLYAGCDVTVFATGRVVVEEVD